MREQKKRRHGAASPISQKAIEARRKAGLAVQLRLAGATHAEIAEQLGYTCAASAHRAVERGMRALGKPEDAEKLRSLEIKRLDRLQRGLWNAAVGGKDRAPDMDAVEKVLKIMARRARLCGLDAPVKVAQTDSSGRDLTVEQAREQLTSIYMRLRAGVNGNGNGHAGGNGNGKL